MDKDRCCPKYGRSTTGYDDAPVGKGKEVAISYLAIRYNK